MKVSTLAMAITNAVSALPPPSCTIQQTWSTVNTSVHGNMENNLDYWPYTSNAIYTGYTVTTLNEHDFLNGEYCIQMK
jgi:hypothetical protein